MKPQLPAPPQAQFNPDYTGVKDDSIKNCVASLARQVATEFSKVYYNLRPQRQLLLYSPSNDVYAVTVDNSGALTATKIKL